MWASQTFESIQPSDSRKSIGRSLYFSRQYASSSSVSQRWVCMRTPHRFACAAVAFMRSVETENGAQGARPIWIMA